MSPFTLPLLIAATGWAVLGLFIQAQAARSHGARSTFSPAAGDPAAGVRYALTKGMTPQAKESVRTHLGTYALGLLYHAGIGASALALVVAVLGFAQPRLAVPLLAGPMIGGTLAGLALFVKRLSLPTMRSISHPDDYLSNGLVTAFAGFGALATLQPHAKGPASIWTITAVLLLLWIPLGKIRHCLFFFLTRVHFGTFFGRRGVLPPSPTR